MKILIALLSVVSLQAIAIEETETKYRYPSDLSAAEHEYLIISRSQYDECLKKKLKRT